MDVHLKGVSAEEEAGMGPRLSGYYAWQYETQLAGALDRGAEE
jgi:hypothetical protein